MNTPGNRRDRYNKQVSVTVTLTFNNMNEAELRQLVHEIDGSEWDSQEAVDANAIRPGLVTPLDVVSLWAAGLPSITPTKVEGSWSQGPTIDYTPTDPTKPTDEELARINVPDYVIAALREWLLTNQTLCCHDQLDYDDVHQWVWGNSELTP